jgi:hypothetical protein
LCSTLARVGALRKADALLGWTLCADRHDRKRLLITAEAGLGVVATCYAVAAATGTLGLPVIAVSAAV